MRVKRDIVDPTGRVCGSLETTLCDSELDLDECIRFSKIPGGFAQYRAQIPLPEIWPMAVINSIDVYPPYQRRKLASQELEKFLKEARQHGAQTAFLRVGWSGNDPDAERAWRVAWYSRMGFIELQNTAPHLAIPFMFRPL